ncbi:glycosyltransferase family 2 protein [Verrucomicrobium spinosum]|uniref:glycosyltransferase family 2 protein n=1 Tax=Verrucomicrobium spinosum TaxID=2736 RepID=UPI00155D9C44|nr:glycosyltransferase [Verrucomicrobium spinosum]
MEEVKQGHLRVRWSLPNPPPVAIIIPTRNFRHLLEVAVESVLARTDYPNFRLVIVDNDSNEESTLDYLASLQAQGKADVLRIPGPFNYSLLNNRAVAACTEPVVCLLNNDIEIHERDWLREMVSQAVRPGVGAVGTKLYYPDGRIQHAGVILGMGGQPGIFLRDVTAAMSPTGGGFTFVRISLLSRPLVWWWSAASIWRWVDWMRATSRWPSTTSISV